MNEQLGRLRSIGPLIIILVLQSCSWVSNRKAIFDSPGDEVQSSENQTVSKKEYDELMKRYQELQKKGGNATASQQQDAQNILNQLEQVKGENEISDTVDVFSKQADTQTPVIAGEDAESEIQFFHQAVKKMDEKNFDQAFKMFQQLQNSKNLQMKVRGVFYSAEALFFQEQLDLAMQTYEQVIGQYAFSGLVIKSLGRLIACSEKLNLKSKQDQYYSILHDFFGAN